MGFLFLVGRTLGSPLIRLTQLFVTAPVSTLSGRQKLFALSLHQIVELAGGEFEAGLVYSPGPTGEFDTLIERAKLLPNFHFPAGTRFARRDGDVAARRAERPSLTGGP